MRPHARHDVSSEMLAEKTAHDLSDLTRMGFEREVPRIEQMDMAIGQVAFIRVGAGWQKRRIVSPPNGEERRLMFAEVSLKLRIPLRIGAVVANKVQLNLFRSSA